MRHRCKRQGLTGAAPAQQAGIESIRDAWDLRSPACRQFSLPAGKNQFQVSEKCPFFAKVNVYQPLEYDFAGLPTAEFWAVKR
jgi:hypothetical protein